MTDASFCRVKALNKQPVRTHGPLRLDSVVEPTPSHSAHTYADVSHLPNLSAVNALLQGPVPLAHLVHMEVATSAPALGDAVRQFGLQFACQQPLVPDANYDGPLTDVRAMTLADGQRIRRAPKKREGDHA